MPFAVALVGFVFAYVGYRIGSAWVEAFRAQAVNAYRLDERRVAVEERRITLEELAKAPRPKAVPMPADLRNRIASFEDDWAREDEERTLIMLYAEYDDWDVVRKQLRPLNSVMESDTPFAEPPEFVR